MNKVFQRILLTSLILLSIFPNVSWANNSLEMEINFTVNTNKFSVNGQEFEMDVPTIIYNGRAYVPVRFLANSLGISDSLINYNSKTKTVTLESHPTLLLTIDQPQMTIDGVTKRIDVAPINKNDRIYLPARFIAEEFGWDVYWNESKKLVRLTKKIDIIKKEIEAGFVQFPKAVNQENGYQLYSLIDTLVQSGIPSKDITIDSENILLIANSNYKALILKENAKVIYLMNLSGDVFKYNLLNNLIKQDSQWFIQGDDVIKIGMLGTLLQM